MTTTFDIGPHVLSVTLQDEGVWFALEPWIKRGELRVATDDEAAVRLRLFNHPAVKQAIKECHKEHNPLGMERTPAQDEAAMSDAMARALVTGLRGLRINGAEVTFDQKSVRAWLDDRRLPQFRSLCIAGSQCMDHYRDQVEGARLGNSVPS